MDVTDYAPLRRRTDRATQRAVASSAIETNLGIELPSSTVVHLAGLILRDRAGRDFNPCADYVATDGNRPWSSTATVRRARLAQASPHVLG
jgi:hypothetical protein